MTFPDIPTLTRLAKEWLGRDVTRAVDRAKLQPKSPAALVAILEAIRKPQQLQDIKAILNRALPSVLDHLHYSFIVAADEHVFTELIGLTSRTLALTISDTKDVGILSGTLKEWKEIVVRGLQSDDDSRIIFWMIFSYFEQLGLRDIWSEYRKKSLQDSFTLVPHDNG